MRHPSVQSRCAKWACGLLTLALGACAVGPDFKAPAAPVAKTYGSEALPGTTEVAGGQAQRFSTDTRLPTDWWRLFGSPELDALVEQALAHNPGVQAAEASLRQSQDNLRAGQGVFFPQLGLNAQAVHERTTTANQGLSLPGSVFNVYALSGNVSYVLDLFGHDRRVVEGLQAQADLQGHLRRAAYLSLSANVVNTAIAYAAYDVQTRQTELLLALQETQAKEIEAQYRAGTAAYASVLQQQALLAATRAALAPLRQRRSAALHLLAALSGQDPDQWQAPRLDLAQFKTVADLPLSLPSELVRQRPDILAAEAQLHIASANVGVATSDLYPQISLNGSYGAASNSWGNLSAAKGRFWSVGPSLSLPLFQGGSAWYTRKAAEEAFMASQASYRQTVLAAFEQVADALKALEHDAQAMQAQGDALRLSEDALHLAQVNERAGLIAGTDALAAQIQVIQARINELQARAQRHQDTVALFAALGGGWWNGPERQP